MSSKVLSFVIDTTDDTLDPIMAAAVDEIHKAGHTIREIRLTTDAGEQKIPANTVPGVTVTEPVSSDTSEPQTPTTQPEPAPPTGDETPQVVVTPGPDVITETPSDVPVDTPPADPTPVVAPADTPPA